MTKRKRFITLPRLIILALIVIVAIMGLWVFIRSQLITGFATGVHELEAQGYQVSHDGLSVDGFPLKLKAHTGALSISAPSGDTMDSSKNWSVKTGALHVNSATLTPLSWQVTHADTMRVDMRSASGERYMFDVMPADFVVGAGVDFKGHIKSASLDLASTRLESLVGASPIIRSVQGLKGKLNVTDGNGTFTLDISDLVMDDAVPHQIKSLLGTKVEDFQITGTIDNIQSLINGELGDWQANGAKVNIDNIAINWGALKMIGDANITMRNNQANGTLTFKFSALQNLLALAHQENLIEGPEYQMARMYLVQTQKDENNRVAVPLTIKDNQLKFFTIVLADLNP